ncbi:ovalbumin-like [Echinops telfairi]|uniref:Ovalbumin-like n=1 Tax=Echinops telfairi TaxID=9371 RepID=A0ABM0IM25_ECHTE|nr:ovalbumin-like [Echinops telfairi]
MDVCFPWALWISLVTTILKGGPSSSLSLRSKTSALVLRQTPARAMDSISAANTQFCFDVFKEMSPDHTSENLVYSPLGLLSTLALVLFGARGQSASQIAKVLHLDALVRTSNSSSAECGQDTGVHEHIQALLSEIQKSNSGEIYMSSGIFADTNNPFLQSYLDCIEQLYKIKPRTLDFMTSLEDARMQINSWVEIKTKGEIEGLFPYEDIVPYDQLVLVNPIFFRGKWKNAFQKEGTQTMAFWMDEFRSKPVQMMRVQGLFKLGIINDPQVQVLQVSDVDGYWSMVIILPRENVGLGQRNVKTDEISKFESSKYYLRGLMQTFGGSYRDIDRRAIISLLHSLAAN